MNSLQLWAPLAGVAAGLIALPALGAGYAKPPLRVMPADAVLTAPSARQPPYRLGNQFFLERQNRLPDDAVNDLTNAGFEVRLFRIEDERADPEPWKQDQDHCDIFLSLVFKHRKFRGDRVDIGPLSNKHWLTQEANGEFTSGYYLVVIEQDSAADAPSERGNWEVFRLSRALRDQYFKQGVRIRIDPPGRRGEGRGWGWGWPARTVPPDEDTQVKQALDLVARTISSKFNCYQTHPVRTAAAGASQVALASCAVEPATPEG